MSDEMKRDISANDSTSTSGNGPVGAGEGLEGWFQA